MSNSTPDQTSEPSVPEEDYYVGVDLGQKRDHSVVAVILKKNGQVTLVHMKRFALGTEYQAVIEYLKLVAERRHLSAHRAMVNGIVCKIPDSR